MIRDSGGKSSTSFLALVFFLLCSARAVPAYQASMEPTEGVKVLSVDKGSEAEKAGLTPGDTIATWAQGAMAGVICSPLDFKGIERERAERGAVTLHGTRLGKNISWALKRGTWGIRSVPVWPGVDPILDRLKGFAHAGQWDALTQYCRATCVSLDAPSGARGYAFSVAGALLAGSEKWKDAGEFFGKALAQEPKGATYFKPQIYEVWANAYFAVNDWVSAYRYYEKALQASDRHSLNAAFYLHNMARAKRRDGSLREANRLATAALRIVDSAAPRSELAVRILNSLAVISTEWSNLGTADLQLRRALSIVVQTNLKSDAAAMVYNSLGNLVLQRGESAEAEKYYLRSLFIARDLNPDGKSVSDALGNLGNLAAGCGNFVKAELCFRKALALEEKAGPDGEIDLAVTLTSLADISRVKGDTTAAAALLRRALAIQKRVTPNGIDRAVTLANYGRVLQITGDFTGAKESLLESLAIHAAADPGSLFASECRYNLGEFYAAKGDLATAEREFRISSEIHRLLSPRGADYADSLGSLAAVEERLGKQDAARNHYSMAMQIVDSQSALLERSDSMHFGSTFGDLQQRFAALLLAQGQIRRAFELLDHSRARTLVRTLVSDHVNVHSGIHPMLWEKDQKLEASLADLSEQRIRALTEAHGKGLSAIDTKIADATTEHDLTERLMRAANPSYAVLTQPKPPSLPQIQSALEPETVLLEYSLGKDRSDLFAVSSSRVTFFPLPARAQLDPLARHTHEQWSKPERTSEGDHTSQALSDLILGPAADFVKGKRRLLIVADGSLQYVPFAALPVPKTWGRPGGRVASQFEVVNLPSASLLVRLRQHPRPRSKDRDSIAIIGDPVFAKDDPRITAGMSPGHLMLTASRSANPPPDDLQSLLEDDTSLRGLRLNRLVYSREEAETIAALSSRSHLLVALDFDANRAIAMDPRVANSRIVHFATHGLFDAGNPAMSGLVLSLVDKNGNPQAGFLGLDDIYRSRLSADLVVLSSCETALGEEVSGEGLVGLTWGFIYAGAKSVVASLWQVNDASTAELMKIFYTAMERRHLSPAAALREAQIAISLKPQWSSPYYWAGFVIEGEYGAGN